MKGINIVGYSKCIPKTIVTNDDLSKMLDTSDEWIVTRTGIKQRHFAQQMSNTDMAYQVAKDILSKPLVDKGRLKAIIVATFTPDYFTPSIATDLHQRLKLKEDIMCFDLNAACSGFIYGLEVARGLLTKKNYILLICSEKISSYLDFKDRASCILFGDGAAGILIEKSSSTYHSVIKTRGNLGVLKCQAIQKNNYLNKEIDNIATFAKLSMDGAKVFKFAIEAIKDGIDKVLKKASLKISDVDYIICHQANKRIISHVAKKLRVNLKKFYMNMDEYGNTSAASIPIALTDLLEKGLVKRNDKIIFVGFGAGLTWGAVLIEY